MAGLPTLGEAETVVARRGELISPLARAEAVLDASGVAKVLEAGLPHGVRAPPAVGPHLAGRGVAGAGRGAPGATDPGARLAVGAARGRPGPAGGGERMEDWPSRLTYRQVEHTARWPGPLARESLP